MEWRAVVGWEGFYEVSKGGDVRSIARTIWTRKGWMRFPGRVLRQGLSGSTYPQVVLSRPGQRRPLSHNVHSLVAAAYIGPRPDGMQVCHRDGSTDNNAADNLRYGTPTSNAADRKLHGTDTHGNAPRGEANAASILTEAAVRAIRKDPRTLKAIAADYGVSFGAIHCIKTNKTWRHVA